MQSVRYITPRSRGRVSRALKSLEIAMISSPIDRLLSFAINPGDTVVVCGFWRSGTTWLQQALAELLQAKAVFEPLHPQSPAVKEIYSYNQLSTKNASFLARYMPYCGDSTLNDPYLHRFFDKALRANLPGNVVRTCRNGVAESFRRRVVMKCVRVQLCLRAAQNTFLMPVIYLYRDPRAVIASIKREWWGKGDDKTPCLREQLIEPRDGRADFFGNWSDEILEFDHQDWVARYTAYWALTEKFVQHCYTDGQARIAFVSYEELCRKREHRLSEILKQLGVSHISSKGSCVLDVESRTTWGSRRGASVGEKIAGWRKELSTSEIATIESITQHFGFSDRLVNDG